MPAIWSDESLRQNAIVPTTDFRFDWVAREGRNLALTSAYDLEKDYAHAKFSDSEPGMASFSETSRNQCP